MLYRIAPIVVIYLCTAATWIFLAKTVDDRTREYESKLRGSVGELWGIKQKQEAPTALARSVEAPKSGANRSGQQREGSETKQEAPLVCRTDGSGDLVALQASNLNVSLSLEHRQKGLLWYSTYRVKFGGRYEITNSTAEHKCITFVFKFPSEKAIYDDVRFLVGGEEIPDLPIYRGTLTRVLSLAPGQSDFVEVVYVTNGTVERQLTFFFGGTFTTTSDIHLAAVQEKGQLQVVSERAFQTSSSRSGTYALDCTGSLVSHYANGATQFVEYSYDCTIP